jgi:hypothetical protein
VFFPALWRRRFDKVENIMEEMDEVEAEIENEILKVHERFWARKHEVLQKRNAALKAVPNFWAKACDNHPSLGQLFNQLDKEILKSVDSLESDESNPSVGFTLIFHFKPNPYFTNKTLTLQSKTPQDPEEECTIIPSPIDWKDQKVRAVSHCHLSPSVMSLHALPTSLAVSSRALTGSGLVSYIPLPLLPASVPRRSRTHDSTPTTTIPSSRPCSSQPTRHSK